MKNTYTYKTSWPEYQCLLNARQRCTNPKVPSYENYGARGITVSPVWCGDGGFQRFMEHVGPRPSADHSLDRIDNDRGYEPGNVRWATRSEQARNRRPFRSGPRGKLRDRLWRNTVIRRLYDGGMKPPELSNVFELSTCMIYRILNQ